MKPDSADEHGLNQITGYLLWHAEVEQARRQAAVFTSHLPWLTTGQREDVERVYIADRVAASRAMLEQIRDRAVALRGEYSRRYGSLKRRCVAAAAGCTAVVAGVAGVVVLISR
ncbi:hypothetical protein [Actinacidiphila bryophytorum]|uniref:Uncharacterized protein n=1 Tax=Actinacidiphila bryophytorum TaxID=1436133 RepID=A0A9W4ECR6_9ACTN|nr:hypothetical protein [Actinacidiphila bryophytorum]MBM9435335.1 hypothetical protein [Actinacidiphila bryophytorum]MBN6542178.1 hypothetical protein [Actinacidiphila bryophytorum]CAG7606944.1 conserved hypothetical protein [Actinacidiphila bryophytorum]